MDDHSLVKALQAGEPDAARNLIERFQNVVFGLCLRMLAHRQDAEDVAQETFIRALRSIGSFDTSRELRPWLLGIAANRCRTAIGRRARRLAELDPEIDPTDHRSTEADPDDIAGELRRAVDNLRPDYRLVFLLYHEQALPYEEIASAVGRPIGTVKTWLHRARSELAEALAKRGVDVGRYDSADG